MKKIFIFHHSDLDGMGVKILASKYAEEKGFEYETHKCNYNDVDQIVCDTLKEVSTSDIEEVIIGDISVNEQTAEFLDHLFYSGVAMRLRDHHATAEWLNKYPWAKVQERDTDGIERCGTWLLSSDSCFDNIRELMGSFIYEVDMWDTWKWKSVNDINATNLNALFQILGEEDFTNYILSIDCAGDLFTEYGKTMIEAHERQVKKVAENCEAHMWVMDLSIPNKSNSYKTGVVFCNHDISDVGNLILDKHPELDILMLVSNPKSISYRTQKHLDVPLGDVAKMITGSGGGHPMAAGSVISPKQFQKAFLKTLGIFSGNRTDLKFTGLSLAEKE